MNLEHIKVKMKRYMTFKKYLALIGFGGMVYTLIGQLFAGLFLIMMFLLGLSMLDKFKEELEIK